MVVARRIVSSEYRLVIDGKIRSRCGSSSSPWPFALVPRRGEPSFFVVCRSVCPFLASSSVKNARLTLLLVLLFSSSVHSPSPAISLVQFGDRTGQGKEGNSENERSGVPCCGWPGSCPLLSSVVLAPEPNCEENLASIA